MQQLSPNGRLAIEEIARRHGFSFDAVLSMLESVINGNGGMAQFNHPEFSGSGQWMQGGMTMVSDMFNNYLKNRVDSLCSELARLVANQPDLLRTGSFQSQSQGGSRQGGQQQNNYANTQYQDASFTQMDHSASLFVPPALGKSADWWPADLRWPNSTGAQNDVRYAYFAQARRLVIELNGRVTVYDTLDHQIGGFSQQQSYGGSICFNSQYGLIDVARLPIISIDGIPQASQANNNINQSTNMPIPVAVQDNNVQPVAATQQQQQPSQPQPKSGNTADADIFVMIEKLADLRSRDLLSEAEFVTKKTELLARL
ncbi:SHOCT domain-containing protein [Glaciimonas sp. Gout2]|uniref:SHOCT domain-containing protein n=1 Tax=unclassified Glaciimonas TaxID=2644401 RepID=UPI002B22C42C|nr:MULTISPECIES: SHOCT domain-containing protein [unclassified Glaciimonas]MEB0011374.1 SHOCT domain-containing protein [Glaciimonas sp. Cout2]MEB0081024.1 SHOCT domain-containing protein [Glaciimonas sp. Gout2]